MLGFLSCCSTRGGEGGRIEAQEGGVGIGWETDSRGSFVVARLIGGGPAEECGVIRKGDKLVSIDGTLPYNLESLVRLLRGPSGSLVTLVIESSTSGAHMRVQLRRKTLNFASDGRVSVTLDPGASSTSALSSSTSPYRNSTSGSSNAATARPVSSSSYAVGGELPEKTNAYNHSNNNPYRMTAPAGTMSSGFASSSSPDWNAQSSPTLRPMSMIAQPSAMSSTTTSSPPATGELFGVGVTFYMNHRGSWSVDSVQCSYDPATKIQPDDELISVDGENVEYAATEEIARLILGKKNTTAILGFRRGDETFDIPLGRFFQSGRRQQQPE